MYSVIQNAMRNYTDYRSVIKLSRNVSLSCSHYGRNEKPSVNFVPVYRFPYIRPFSIINRLKAYQTIVTIVSVPVSIGLYQLNYISSDALQFTASLGITSCLALYSLGYWTQNFIGFLYYDKENDIVKISYINFWGQRKDIEVSTNDIIPINELPSSFLDGLYFQFRRFSTNETLKFNLRFGMILDKELIKQIL